VALSSAAPAPEPVAPRGVHKDEAGTAVNLKTGEFT